MNTTTETIEMSQATASVNLDRTMSNLKDGVAQATASMEQAQSAMRQGMEKAMKSATEMFTFAQGNFEAFTKSGQIWAAGLQELTQSFAASSKASAEETMAAMKAIGTAKSIKEAMDLQAALMRSTLEKTVAETSKLTDTTMKLSEQALAPIGARMSLAAEKFGRV
jgi:phasin family protein